MQSAEGRSEMNTYRLAKVRPVITRSHYAPKVMKLQLTLDLRDIRGEDLSALKKYGDVTENISRTVFVPAGMPLHALHYLINQAFGWQNSHLHNFELPEDIRDVLTENGRLSRWAALCGVYFRFPEQTDDEFWDDDYEEGISFKTWMRSKYRGPYYDGAKSETYVACQKNVSALREEFSVFEARESFGEMWDRQEKDGTKDGPRSKGTKHFEDATVSELESACAFEKSFYDLIESTPLVSILATEETLKKTADIATCSQLAARMAVPVPVTNILSYCYDFGDDWHVTIECLEEYFDSDDPVIQKVSEKLQPICIASDGLPVMDDAGNIYGYIEHLREMKAFDPDDPEAVEYAKETKAWARMQGWTGRHVKPENIL